MHLCYRVSCFSVAATASCHCKSKRRRIASIVCNQDFLVFSQNFQSNTTLRFQGEPSQIMLTMYTYHHPPPLSLSPSPSIQYFRSIVHVDRIMLLQKICAYIRVRFLGGNFSLGKLQLRRKISFLVINWKTSRCEARTWRDVINEFEIDL